MNDNSLPQTLPEPDYSDPAFRAARQVLIDMGIPTTPENDMLMWLAVGELPSSRGATVLTAYAELTEWAAEQRRAGKEFDLADLHSQWQRIWEKSGA